MRHRRIALLLVACASAAALLATQRNTPRTAIGGATAPGIHVESQLNPPHFPLTPETLEALRRQHTAPTAADDPAIPQPTPILQSSPATSGTQDAPSTSPASQPESTPILNPTDAQLDALLQWDVKPSNLTQEQRRAALRAQIQSGAIKFGTINY